MSTAVENIPADLVMDQPLESQMTLSMGPQHPSTHGVLRLDLRLDGEMVTSAIPDIGYLHTGMEKLFEYKKYQQGIVITDRMDYLNPLGNNLAYVMAAEKLLGIEIPERAQVIRVLMCELQRIASHMVWLGTHAKDTPIGGYSDVPRKVVSIHDALAAEQPVARSYIVDERGCLRTRPLWDACCLPPFQATG